MITRKNVVEALDKINLTLTDIKSNMGLPTEQHNIVLVDHNGDERVEIMLSETMSADNTPIYWKGIVETIADKYPSIKSDFDEIWPSAPEIAEIETLSIDDMAKEETNELRRDALKRMNARSARIYIEDNKGNVPSARMRKAILAEVLKKLDLPADTNARWSAAAGGIVAPKRKGYVIEDFRAKKGHEIVVKIGTKATAKPKTAKPKAKAVKPKATKDKATKAA